MRALLDRHQMPFEPARRVAALIFGALMVAACSQSGAAGSVSAPSVVQPSASEPPPAATPSALPAVTSSPTVAATASPVAAETASPTASGPCIDVGQLADSGDSVENQLDAIKTALAAKNVADARAAAATAGVGMKSLADLAATASPQARQLFLKAATELAKAATEFPNGGATYDQARRDFEQAFVVARAVGCPT